MKIKFSSIWGLTVLVLSGPLSAHHSVGVFDTGTPVWVKGSVVRVDSINPHAVIYLEQEREDGQVLRWAVESSPPVPTLQRRGFTKDTLKAGDIIEACGYAPKKKFTSSIKTRHKYWLDHPDRVITGRLLLLPDGPDLHWSHYGPLEKCMR